MPPRKRFVFNPEHDDAAAWASQHAAELVSGVSSTTRRVIHDLVVAAFAEDVTIDDLVARIADALGDTDRAETIARTESMRAANAGQQQAWDQATAEGFLTGDEQKVWITTPDDRLCPICEPLDGVAVPIDGAFDVDGEALEGPPAHPNCRCVTGLQA